MIDQVIIRTLSGKGGNGAVSGRREKFVPRGGPDGGNGGDGGSIYAVCDPNLNTLLSFRYQREFRAGPGGNGEGARKHGANGDDMEVSVPAGTQIWVNRPRSRLLADLTEPDQRQLLAKGGGGGRGNATFASSTNRFPVIAEEGEAGEALELRLELKLLADVGIMGEPNAGKSSLLAAVSAATPKIADYPFTTIEPALGVVEHRRQSFVVVDIPGLIEGAHAGVGLGHDFLRHIERTRVLVHLIDGSQEDPIGAYHRVNNELALFDERLADKPQVVVVNKSDLPGVAETAELLKQDLDSELSLHLISAATHDSVPDLLDVLLTVLEDAPVGVTRGPSQVPADEIPVLRPKPRREGPRVVRKDGAFVVRMPEIERIAALLDQDDWQALAQFYARMKRLGVVRALERAGVAQGDTVRIGELEWEWE